MMVATATMIAQDSNLRFLETMRWLRKEFPSRLCAESTTDDAGVLTTLRQESAYQVAEFFYLLKARQLSSVSELKLLVQLHNDHLVNLSRDPIKMNRLGLSHDRIHGAIFTSDTLPRIIELWEKEPGTFDQSNLARLLATTMSAETCRTTLVAFDRAGFVSRRKSPAGVLLVRSEGRLETILADCLSEARDRLQDGDD